MSDIKSKIALLYNHLPLPIEVIDEAGKIIYINKAFSKLWGYELSELSEYNFFGDPEIKRKGLQNKFNQFYKENSDSDFFFDGFIDSLLKRKETTLPVLHTKIFPLNINNGRYIVLVHEDQTEIFLNEAEIIKAREGNKEAERLKDTFLNVLSHELRTPLNIVLGYSSIIKESMRDKIGAEERVYLDNLYSGSERLFKSITQMLEFAQIEAGSFKMTFEAFDLVSLFYNSISLISSDADKKEIKIKSLFKRDNILISADLQCTENAINNLLNNAVKFTKQGFIEIEVDVIDERDVAICKIKDSGVGISTEYLDHLFRPFSQEDLKIGRNYEGNGLGLALAKRYIEKMGGSLLVDSIKGVGSTFTFTLPLANSEIRTTKKAPPRPELKKLFLLDSEKESIDLLNAFVKNKYSIVSNTFSSFNIASINESKFEAILLDVDQSHWEKGQEICENIKSITSSPIIILSSEYMDERIKMFYNSGADKVLIKPYSKMELIKTIDELSQKRTEGIK